MIIDYSTARPSIATLKAHGVTAAGRYIGWDSVPGFTSIGKNITKAEAEHLLAAGIEIFLAFEYAKDAALRGHAQGLKDGELASSQLREIGAPPHMGVYYAVDFDLKDYAPASKDPRKKLGPVADYFDGIHAAKPAHMVNGYGGYWTVMRLMDAGLIHDAWQASAWSPRNPDGSVKFDPRAVLRQQLGTPLPGADLDTVRLNTVHLGDFGQWPRPDSVKYFTYETKGTLTAHALAHKHGISFPHMCRLTSDHFGGFPEATRAWLEACADPDSFVDLKNPTPAGVTWRLPVIGS